MLARFLLLATALYAQDDPATRLDAIFKDFTAPNEPGVSVAVIQGGTPVFHKGYGLANLEYDAPIKPDTIFHVASVSKQFTAMAIVLLEQDGKLKLEDDVHRYLPELPDYGAKITIRNLLQHTSGIRDQWQTLALAGWRLDDVITQQQVLRVLFRQKELNFAPGTQHLYSNAGFTLLAEIVSRVSGKPLPAFCDERIFKPLGMTHTHFHDDLRRVVPGRAYSYERAGAGYRASPLNYATVGATSLFTTAPDLLKWLDNFREPKVGGAAAVARLQEQAVLASGEKVDYALGLSIGTNRGLPTISHGGSDAGFRSYVAWYPKQKLGVVVLANGANINAGMLANRVAAVFVENEMELESGPKPRETRATITVDPASLDRFTGVYLLGDLPFAVDRKEGKIMASPGGPPGKEEFLPVAPARFFSERMQAEMAFDQKPSNGMTMRFITPGGTMSGERIATAPFDPKDMEKYTGVYWSDELEAQYTVTLRDGKLFAQHIRHGDIALRPVAKDFLGSQEWFMPNVRFVTEGGAKASAMILGGNRITGIRFTRR